MYLLLLKIDVSWKRIFSDQFKGDRVPVYHYIYAIPDKESKRGGNAQHNNEGTKNTGDPKAEEQR